MQDMPFYIYCAECGVYGGQDGKRRGAVTTETPGWEVPRLRAMYDNHREQEFGYCVYNMVIKGTAMTCRAMCGAAMSAHDDWWAVDGLTCRG